MWVVLRLVKDVRYEFGVWVLFGAVTPVVFTSGRLMQFLNGKVPDSVDSGLSQGNTSAKNVHHDIHGD